VILLTSGVVGVVTEHDQILALNLDFDASLYPHDHDFEG